MEMRLSASDVTSSTPNIPLRRFSDEGQSAESSMPYSLRDYLALVDWSGRAIRDGTENCSCVSSDSAVHGGRKRSFISANLPRILKRLNIDAEAWGLLVSRQGVIFGRAMGRLGAMRLHAATLGQSWVRGVREAERIYSA